MTESERAHRFSASSIDELNGLRKTRYGSTKNFALLLAGLAALLLLLYLQIVVIGTVGRLYGGWASTVPTPARSAHSRWGSFIRF